MTYIKNPESIGLQPDDVGRAEWQNRGENNDALSA
jgi:hypothetical protein